MRRTFSLRKRSKPFFADCNSNPGKSRRGRCQNSRRIYKSFEISLALVCTIQDLMSFRVLLAESHSHLGILDGDFLLGTMHFANQADPVSGFQIRELGFGCQFRSVFSWSQRESCERECKNRNCGGGSRDAYLIVKRVSVEIPWILFSLFDREGDTISSSDGRRACTDPSRILNSQPVEGAWRRSCDRSARRRAGSR